MVAGNQLWIGTGKGVVLIFTVSVAVIETEAVIAKLVRDKTSFSILTEGPGDRETGHGLVTAELASVSQELRNTEPLEKKGGRNEYYRNRRTAFGRTLRGPSMKQTQKSPAVFQLEFESSYQLEQAEPVRVLLSMR